MGKLILETKKIRMICFVLSIFFIVLIIYFFLKGEFKYSLYSGFGLLISLPGLELCNILEKIVQERSNNSGSE